MRRLPLRHVMTWSVLAILAGAVLLVGYSPVRQAFSQVPSEQAQSDQDKPPQGQMPMMRPGQDRWMWPGCCGMMRGMQGQRMGPGRGRWMGRGASMVRHMYYMHNGIPSEYRGRVNPLPASPETVRDGARLYAGNCASCHGARGFGDGEAGKGLNPPPANLAHMIRMPMLNDEYMLWTMSEGGAPVGSEMPAFKDTLTEEEMWKIVAAMRAGFPSPPQATADAEEEPQKSDTAQGNELTTDDVRAQIKQWIQWYGNPQLKVGSIIDTGKDTIVAEIVGEDDSVVQRIEINRRTGWMRPVQKGTKRQ